ncbi:MAG: alginate export family protein [Cyclobacteriaceae bacterium]|nr:alginate export family protein [Cyclobacteriaceae bacterium]
MRKIIIYVALIVSGVTQLQAQFTFSGEYRPRAEYRHGFANIPDTKQKPAFFTDQRSRINLYYQSEKYDVKIVLQDIRTWGSQPQLVANDGATTTIHEAWGQIKLNSWFSAKFGRQEISYDDQRIFGSVGWAQQARSHDAAIFKVNSNGYKVDVGIAYNQDSPQNTHSYYTVAPSYKTFQYIWAHKDFDALGVSFLFLNLGNQGGTLIPQDYKTYYQQTVGGRFTYKKDAFSANAATYSQFGEMTNGTTKLNGLLFSIDAGYTFAEKHTLVAGFEHISGNDEVTNVVNRNQAFNPYFGTNHKFNGLMDYFYVGNHLNNVGLNDIQFGYKGKFTEKFNAGIMAHLFSSDGNIENTINGGLMNRQLGTEIDITGGYKLYKDVSIAFGYSHMLSTDTMVELKNSGDKDETANWAWLMITIKPTFFTTKEKEKE